MTHAQQPRDPRLRRRGDVDPLAAAVRLQVAVDAMRSDQRGRGPEPVYYVDEVTDLAAVAAAAQGATSAAPLSAAEFAAALGPLDDDHTVHVAPSDPPPPAAVPVPPAPPAAAPLPTLAEVYRADGYESIAAVLEAELEPRTPMEAAVREVRARSDRSELNARLNWRSRHDPRSLGFGVRARLAGSAPISDRRWPVGPVLDQGSEGRCVGFGVVGAVNAFAAGDRDLGVDDADRLYRRAQQLDAIPGEDYSGTSVLAGMQAAVEAGLFGGYLWAFGTRDVAQAVLQRGPVVVGVPWLSGMYDTGPGGLVRLAGDDMGVGHCLAVVGIVRKGPQGQDGPFFVWLNSWGPGYGDNGLGYIHHRDLARLLHGSGEAAIPTLEAQAPR